MSIITCHTDFTYDGIEISEADWDIMENHSRGRTKPSNTQTDLRSELGIVSLRDALNGCWQIDFYFAMKHALCHNLELSQPYRKKVISLWDIAIEDYCINKIYTPAKDTWPLESAVIVRVNTLFYGDSKDQVDVTEEIQLDLQVNISYTLDDEQCTFAVNSITNHISNSTEFLFTPLLDEYLVPILRENDYEAYAEKILNKFYPEALTKAMTLNPRKLAAEMFLNVRDDLRLTPDLSTSGCIYFADGMAKYWDESECTYKEIQVHCGTVLIDSRLESNPKRYARSLVHECVHAYELRFFFKLQRATNTIAFCYSSPENNKQISSVPTGNPLYWAEKHACNIPSHLQMPRNQLKKIADGIKGTQQYLNEESINAIADFFGVTTQSARNRLVTIGYPEANNRLILAASVFAEYSERHIQDGYSIGNTHRISKKDSMCLYLRDESFADCINSGNFVFCNEHICINDPLYIADGHLTEYAISHMTECCLSFTEKKPIVPYVFGKGVLNCPSNDLRYPVYEWEKLQNSNVITLSEKIRQDQSFEDALKFIQRDISDLSFAETLVYHLEAMDMTQADLIRRCEPYIDIRTVKYMMSTDHWRCPQIRTIAIIVLLLNLHKPLGLDLVEKAGYSLKRNDEERLIASMINSYYDCTIDEWNEALIECGYDPLCKIA